MTVGITRLVGALTVLAAAWYVPWMLAHLNTGALWLAIPFAAANLLLVVATLVCIVNRWDREEPLRC